MGQHKGNPSADRSYQNQAYMNLTPNDGRTTDSNNATKTVMVDADVRPAEALLSWGSFSDITTQSASLANTAYSMKLNTIEGASGFTIENDALGFPTRIKALKTGVYNIQFSAQLENTANTNIVYDIWLAYTGSNVVRSSTSIDVTKTAQTLGRGVAAWNFVYPIQALDYVELKWACSSTTGVLMASGSNGGGPGWIHPSIPSVIATVTQVG